MKDLAMRFLANENVTGTVIQELRQRGHDGLSVKESMRSERDDVNLARVQSGGTANRLALTGNLVSHSRH
jgi:hypothetical protein